MKLNVGLNSVTTFITGRWAGCLALGGGLSNVCTPERGQRERGEITVVVPLSLNSLVYP